MIFSPWITADFNIKKQPKFSYMSKYYRTTSDNKGHAGLFYNQDEKYWGFFYQSAIFPRVPYMRRGSIKSVCRLKSLMDNCLIEDNHILCDSLEEFQKLSMLA